jgi:hypothetical protein
MTPVKRIDMHKNGTRISVAAAYQNAINQICAGVPKRRTYQYARFHPCHHNASFAGWQAEKPIPSKSHGLEIGATSFLLPIAIARWLGSFGAIHLGWHFTINHLIRRIIAISRGFIDRFNGHCRRVFLVSFHNWVYAPLNAQKQVISSLMQMNHRNFQCLIAKPHRHRPASTSLFCVWKRLNVPQSRGQ